MKHLYIILVFFGTLNLTFGQNELKIADSYIRETAFSQNLQSSDIQYRVSSSIEDTELGITHFYLQQTYQNIDIFNAIYNVHVKNNSIFYATSRWINNIALKTNTSQPTLSSEAAIHQVLKYIGYTASYQLQFKEKKEDVFIFDKGDIAFNDITAKLVYFYTSDDKLTLAWNINLDATNGNDYWSIRVDATTGKILEKTSFTTSCSFGNHQHDNCEQHQTTFQQKKAELLPPNGIGAYRVFAPPVESPTFGNRTLLNDPNDIVASPFGWHDTSGVVGPEFLITRGNNVHAYLDTNGDNKSDGNEPNGGASLLFDFPYSLNSEPDSVQPAAVTNLFYMNNFMHDFSYKHGFDEKSGNFQQNNYGRGGKGNDYLFAEAQDNSKAASPSLNNANFSTPVDGANGRMQMFIWNSTASKIFKVNEPQNIEGYYDCSPASTWGKPVDDKPISGDLIIAIDANNSTLVCAPIVNDVNGKIVLLDRGICTFGEKALKVQEAGAKAVCICNFEDALILMAPGAFGNSVTIPVLMLKKGACDAIKQQILSGKKTTATLVLPPGQTGPKYLDGDFDNGIIAHEYAHGISNRLTGGPANTDCLNNGEQMGEGWSDYFSLVVTARSSQNGTEKRPIGTYALRQQPNEPGIRSYPYSTDMSIDPLTYEDILGGNIYRVGEIWASTLWDIYWQMVKLYGFDEDLINGNGGNNKAVKTVIQAMKLQPCSPGMIDGRNALLAADELLYGGAHKCLIWNAFARRGMGYGASQGGNNSTFDGVNSFVTNPDCIKEISIIKTANENIQAGQEITYKIKVSNSKDTVATNVVVTDEIPQGTVYINGSATGNVTFSNGILVFDLGNMPSKTTQEITYKVSTPSDKKSVRQFFDDIESGVNNWDIKSLNDSLEVWNIQNSTVKNGKFAWGISNVATAQDQVLYTFNPLDIKGTKPILRFWQKFRTDIGKDGGFIEYSTDGGTSWSDFNNRIFRQPYLGKIAYSTFAIPNIRVWSGDSKTWVESYIDLSEFSGKKLQFRYRFGSDNGGSGDGWYIDDIEVMDMINYNSQACVTTGQGDKVCSDVPGKGTIVESGTVSSKELSNEGSIEVFPNPTHTFINIVFGKYATQEAHIQIFGLDGKALRQFKYLISEGTILPLDLTSLVAGTYLLKITTDKETIVKKVVKN